MFYVSIIFDTALLMHKMPCSFCMETTAKIKKRKEDIYDFLVVVMSAMRCIICN